MEVVEGSTQIQQVLIAQDDLENIEKLKPLKTKTISLVFCLKRSERNAFNYGEYSLHSTR
ncbi:hypothetical protein [Paenibacillus sp. E194]|uniref:hypothetical protein n=1 Tax=Paenibacillus sp. E194 TaxID=1458845 RepID=UPI003FA5B776